MPVGPALSYARKPGQPFDDERLEAYVRCRASGQSIKIAAEESGLAKSSAQKIEASEAYKERLAEYKSDTKRFPPITVAALMEKLVRNADRAAEESDFKASNQAIQMLLDLVREDATKTSAQFMVIGMRSRDKAIAAGRRDALRAGAVEEILPVDTTGEEVTSDGEASDFDGL